MVTGRAMASFVLVELELFDALVSAVSVGDSVGALWVVLVVVSEEVDNDEDDDDDVVIVVVAVDELVVKDVVMVDEVKVSGCADIPDSDSEELVSCCVASSRVLSSLFVGVCGMYCGSSLDDVSEYSEAQFVVT